MLHFVLNDREVKTAANPATTLLDFIRYDANLRGTKIGCREGDCGACTVLLGSVENGEIRYENCTSCLTPLANAHGRHVVTVEGLNMSELNRAQEAMVSHSGTQCGFCTPGFVVSLCGYALNPDTSLSRTAKDAVDGNICRCTGYKSIERAADQLQEELDNLGEAKTVDKLIDKRFIPAYFRDIPQLLGQIEKDSFKHRGKQPVGGGTDLYVQKHDEMPFMEVAFPFKHQNGTRIWKEGDRCHMAPLCTAFDMMKAPFLNESIPNWYEYMKLVSSNPIRNTGTVAGNLVNASPIGDLTAMLLALNAEITLKDPGDQERTIPLRSFYLDYKKLSKTPEELISRTSFDIPTTGKFNFEKVCKRKYLDIASVNAAALLEEKNGVIFKASFSVGGVSPIPLYLHKTSEYVKGRELTERTILEAAEVLQSEISPISDARGSAEYKRLLASQLFKAHFLNLFPSQIKMSELV